MNPRMYILAVALLLLLLVLGEVCHQKYYTRPLLFTELPFDLGFLQKQYDYQFGSFLIKKDSFYLLVFMDKNKKVNLYNTSIGQIEDSIDLSKYVDGLQFYSAKIINDRLYFLDIDHKSLFLFQISTKRIPCLDTLYHFDSILNWNKYYIRCQARNVFEVKGSQLFLAYGIFNAPSCIDSTAYLEIDLSRSKEHLLVKKVFAYPAEYNRNYHYKTDTWLRFNEKNDKFVGFANNNTIYRSSPGEIGYNKTCFERQSTSRAFDWNKINNLSYIRWFVLTDESNENVVVLNNNTLLLIKRLQKTTLDDENNFEYYILDQDLHTISHNSFQNGIHPWFCYAYKNGFLVAGDKLNKAYYYEAY